MSQEVGQAAPRAVHSEHAFLFTDLVGSTERWERERDRMSVLMREHDDLLTEMADQHGGEVLKRTGDGVVAIFDEPRDAVRCAIAMQRGIGRIDAEGEGMSVRMGIHAGPVERRLGDMYGSAINRAARVMQAAHGGQVLVSELVSVASPLDGVSYVPLGAHRLKGLARPEWLFQVVADGLAQEFPPPVTLNAALGNLPVAADDFYFRDAEAAELADSLASAPITTIVGPGGVGKTSLALHVAREATDRFPDGVWFVDLAAIRAPDLVAATVASLLGVLQRTGLDLTDTLRETLTGRDLLLLLDNCEHLHEEVSTFVRRVVGASTRAKVLCTSQRRLEVPGEHVVRLQPLSLEHSVSFFRDKARQVAPTFVVDDGNREAVEQLCTALDGLPLALELAAARCAVLDPAAIADRLEQRFRLLRSRGANERHRTLEAAIAWSHDLLGAEEQRLLASLAVVHGTFDLPTATAIAGGDEFDVLDTIAELVDRSVVSAKDGTYRLLDSVRAFAAERLAERPDAQDVAERHAEWFHRWALSAGAGIHSEAAPAWLDEVALHLNDLRAAAEWWQHCAPHRVAEMAVALADYWLVRSQTEEGSRWLAEALDGMDADHPSRPVAEAWQGGFCWAHGDLEGGMRWSRASVESAERLGQPFPSIAGTRLAVLAVFGGDPETARMWADRSAAALDSNPAERLFASGPLGVAYGLLGQADEWRRWCADGVAVARRHGPARLSTALTNLLFMQNMRNEDEVVPVATECAELAAMVGSKVAEGNAYIAIGQVHMAKGDLLESLDAYRRGLPALLASGAQPLVIGTIEVVAGSIESRLPADAAALWQATLRLREGLGEMGNRRQRSDRESHTAALREMLGDDQFQRASDSGELLTLDLATARALEALDTMVGR